MPAPQTSIPTEAKGTLSRFSCCCLSYVARVGKVLPIHALLKSHHTALADVVQVVRRNFAHECSEVKPSS